MGFLSPFSFLFLSTVAVLISFYFFKKQFDRQTISSIYLWNQTVKDFETNRWHNKLKTNFLLFLQLLFMIALVFALARPYVTSEGINSDHLVIIVDTSATMAAAEENGTRFELAKEAVEKIVNSLNNEQVVTVIEAGRIPELLTVKETDQGKIKRLLDELSMSYEEADIKESVKLAQSMLHSASGEIHLFSDSVQKEMMQKLTLSHSITVHNFGTNNRNISLQSFGVKAESDSVSGVVTILNEEKSSKTVSLTISSDEKKLKELSVELPPNEVTVVRINDLAKEAVYEAVIAEKDGYQLDNRKYAFLGKQEAPTVYAAGNVNSFVIKALQAFGTEVVSVSKNGADRYVFSEEEEGSIYLLSGVPAEQWPSGPKLIFSPTEGGPLKIESKKELSVTLSGKSDPLLDYVDVNSFYLAKSYPIRESAHLQSIITSGDETIVAKGTSAGAPLVLYSFDMEDSDWPLHPSFPVLLNNSITYLAEHQQALGTFLPGKSEEVTYSSSTSEAFITRDGEKLMEINLSDRSLTLPKQPGLYELQEETKSGTLSRYFAVELSNNERTARVEPSFSLSINHEENSSAGFSQQDIWHWFAVLALIVLFIEWEVYRYGIRGR
ncbi:vWA domain-containing protein [Bacillus taeanensis]|uniref:VWFA domain-containing protein n=1 Tax=Bacillus taeanensis TaxID=273032 RepID=A0A366XPM7_9BACI|nr:BatA and WFA domain-containing protein [Bacillus taeanensis]RBW67686.1 hypothetical protein DS031_20655 [Bacillus taeanensis]